MIVDENGGEVQGRMGNWSEIAECGGKNAGENVIASPSTMLGVNSAKQSAVDASNVLKSASYMMKDEMKRAQRRGKRWGSWGGKY
jgi:hypothetical protein